MCVGGRRTDGARGLPRAPEVEEDDVPLRGPIELPDLLDPEPLHEALSCHGDMESSFSEPNVHPWPLKKPTPAAGCDITSFITHGPDVGAEAVAEGEAQAVLAVVLGGRRAQQVAAQLPVVVARIFRGLSEDGRVGNGGERREHPCIHPFSPYTHPMYCVTVASVSCTSFMKLLAENLERSTSVAPRFSIMPRPMLPPAEW